VYSRHQRKFQVIYAICDAVLVVLAFGFAYLLRQQLPLERDFEIAPPIRILLIAFAVGSNLLLANSSKVYQNIEALSVWKILTGTFRHVAFTMVGFILLEFALRLDLSRPFVGLFAFNLLWMLVAARLSIRRYGGTWWKHFHVPLHVMVAGTGPGALQVASHLEEASGYGFRFQGFFRLPSEPDQETITLTQSYPVYPIAQMREFLEHQVLDEIIFAVGQEQLPSLRDVFVECDEEGIHTRLALNHFPHVNSEMYVETLGTIPMLTFSATPHDELRLLVKRSIDVILASVALLLTAPLLCLVALAVKLTSRGPIFFKQLRCGLNGRRFMLIKFRSMVENAEALRPALEHLNEKSTVFKIRNDPRLTPIGRYLRRFSLDELPQLWNVLRGDMSLVGPRPPIPSEVARYERWQRRRLRMRPGLTCIWAIEGRDQLDFDTMMRKDMQYIDKWSLTLDLYILLRTIPLVLTGKGAN
jgi:exopolysaccharide biosynthesis polyprenyl glycosylphosphotransferase